MFITRTMLRITGDLPAAAVLSQLIYWFGTSRSGGVRAGVKIPHRDNGGDHVWLAKADGEWFEECGVTAKQARRVADQLVDLGLVAVELAKFAGRPCRHWRLIPDVLEEAIRADLAADLLDDEVDSDSPSGRDDVPSGRDDVAERARRRAQKGATITKTFTNELAEQPQRCDLDLAEQSEPCAQDRADVTVGGIVPDPVKPITARWKDETRTLGTWADPASAVFEMWVVVFEKNRNLVKLTTRRRKLIREAVAEYGVGDVRRGVATCLSAIRGATLDAFYWERRREYGDPEHIFRRGQRADTRNNVEYFAGLWDEFTRTGQAPVTGQAVTGRGVSTIVPADLSEVSDYHLVEYLKKGADLDRVYDEIRARRADPTGLPRYIQTYRALFSGRDGWPPGTGGTINKIRFEMGDWLRDNADSTTTLALPRGA